MKKILILLCVVCAIIPFIVYGAAIVKTTKMSANCISYLKMAANANSVQLAEKHLSKSIEYLENNNLTNGYTEIFVYKPTNDIKLWYENLVSAQQQLQDLNSKEELSELEESNALMKLRETLLDSGKREDVTHPVLISFYPNTISWFWSLLLIWLLWVGAVIFGVMATDY